MGQGGGLVGAPIDRRRADAGEGGDVTPKAPVPARPKPLGQQCPFPGLGKLDQDTGANLR